MKNKNKNLFIILFPKITNPIHIGKRSGGWKFLWNANNFEYFKPSKESLFEFLKSGEIEDEEGNKYSFEDFINNELDDFLDKGYDLKSYYKEKPNILQYKIENSVITFFKDTFNINVNEYGEFYIDNLRFTTCAFFR